MTFTKFWTERKAFVRIACFVVMAVQFCVIIEIFIDVEKSFTDADYEGANVYYMTKWFMVFIISGMKYYKLRNAMNRLLGSWTLPKEFFNSENYIAWCIICFLMATL